MKNKRINEIDIFRASAIVLMIIFHTVVDLNDFFGVSIDYINGWTAAIGKTSAFMFIFISGISAVLGKNNLKNAAVTFSAGLIISASTYFILPDLYVIWGILQFLSFSMLVYWIFRKRGAAAFACLSVITLIAGIYISGKTADFPWLLPFGILYPGFKSMDYYPVFPYIALFFAGSFVGKTVYNNKKPVFPRLKNKFLEFLGKYSLVIYLIHQPVIYGILWIVFFIKG
jgi:uncharacterized membrane protein